MKEHEAPAQQPEAPLAVYKAQDLTIQFPDNPLLADQEKSAVRKAIKQGGVAKGDGSTYMDTKSVPTLLHTDKKGANKFYNNLDDADKFENGNTKYASTPAIQKELTRRIEEPRPALEREKLKDSRDCLNAFVDSPELEKVRSLESDRIKQELPQLTKKKMKAENIQADQLTGKPFNNDAQAHHIERKADNPRKATDQNNLVIVKAETHREIHQNGAEDRETLKKLADLKDWNTSIFK